MFTLDSLKKDLNESYYKKNSKKILNQYAISYKENIQFKNKNQRKMFEESTLSEKLRGLITVLFKILKNEKEIDWIETQFAFKVKERTIKFSKKMQIPKKTSYQFLIGMERSIETLPELYSWTMDLPYDDIILLITGYSNKNKNYFQSPFEKLKKNENIIIHLPKEPWFHQNKPIYPISFKRNNDQLDFDFLPNPIGPFLLQFLSENKTITLSYKKDILSKMKKTIHFPQTLFILMKALEDFLKNGIHNTNPLYKCLFQIQLPNNKWMDLTQTIHLYKYNPKDLPFSSLPFLFSFQEILDQLDRDSLYKTDAFEILKNQKDEKNIKDIRIQFSIPFCDLEFHFH